MVLASLLHSTHSVDKRMVHIHVHVATIERLWYNRELDRVYCREVVDRADFIFFLLRLTGGEAPRFVESPL